LRFKPKTAGGNRLPLKSTKVRVLFVAKLN